jgi:2-oxoglutarate ferredoxin oxidoreductase subunit gamma
MGTAELDQIRIGGYGGQGIILAGMLLGKAASLYDGKEAVFTQSYGPEARGGSSHVDVVISDSPINYPLVQVPDVLVVLFQEAYVRFRTDLPENASLIIESDLVHPDGETMPYSSIPATRIAEELGRRIVTNVVVLGYLVGKTGLVTRSAAEKAIETTVKKKTIDLNLRAFAAGYEWVEHKVTP